MSESEFDFTISDAIRSAAPMSFALIGQTGTGKTLSALLLARGLVGPQGTIGIIDTEGGRALVYADDQEVGGFQHMPFEAPYPPEKFSAALKKAVEAGWQAAVVDTASLEHDGEGGLLDMADQEAEAILERNPNNKAVNQQKWTKPKLRHKRMLNYVTGLPMHIIFCFRETLTTDFDKNVSVLTPVMEKNTAFAFQCHAVIDENHNAKWTRIERPFVNCIESGKPISVQMGQSIAAVLSGTSWARLEELAVENDFDEANLIAFVKAVYKMGEADQLTMAGLEQWGPIHHQRIIKVLEKRLKQSDAPPSQPAGEPETEGEEKAPDESANPVGGESIGPDESDEEHTW